jgi:hypothetical protein
MTEEGAIVVEVPKGYRYISEIPDFKINDFPHILNKQIPGCGFTEYCIDPAKNSEDIILCSPRKILLKNKYDQHVGDVFLVENKYEVESRTDKDLTKIEKEKGGSIFTEEKAPTKEEIEQAEKEKVGFFNGLREDLKKYIIGCRFLKKPVKILVTYDSFRIVKDIIKNIDELDNFRVIVDEFQSIFTDSRFKPDTEMVFVKNLQEVKKLCYVSATPMMKKYLSQLDEFKDLPYYELDWEVLDPDRVRKPKLTLKSMRFMYTVVGPIIQKYLDGKFDYRFVKGTNEGEVVKVESKEVVFYVNSVSNITNLIKRAKLKPDQVNILVANTPENTKRIHKRLGRKFNIGTVPLRDEPRKMFTFCTRTVYLGADFYSDNAQTVVLSDANIETLAVDISLDLPQILGRQRLIENPWKDEATVYFRYLLDKSKVNKKSFDDKIKEKMGNTNGLLVAYDELKTDDSRYRISDCYWKIAKAYNYRDDYVAVNIEEDPETGGPKLIPVVNNLVLVSERRAFDMQQTEYADRFTVFNEVGKVSTIKAMSDKVSEFFEEYELRDSRQRKLKFLCESFEKFDKSEWRYILDNLTEIHFQEYIEVLGLEECKAQAYNTSLLNKKLDVLSFDKTKLNELILNEFIVGSTYPKSYIKIKLAELYNIVGYRATAKASDLENLFTIKPKKAKNEVGEWVNGFNIISKK